MSVLRFNPPPTLRFVGDPDGFDKARGEPFGRLGASRAARTPPEMMLTPRERQIQAMRARGWTMQAVADDLGLALSTVKNLHASAYRRFGVDCAADCWRALGWLTVPDDL